MILLLNSRDAAIVRDAYGGSLPPDLVVLPDHYEPLPEVYPQTIERCRRATTLVSWHAISVATRDVAITAAALRRAGAARVAGAVRRRSR